MSESDTQQHHLSYPEEKYDDVHYLLAEIMHDQWSVRKAKEGFVSPKDAPFNNDRIRVVPAGKRVHMNMVPFEELPAGEAEKRLWMAKATIKAANELGFDLRKTKKRRKTTKKRK